MNHAARAKRFQICKLMSRCVDVVIVDAGAGAFVAFAVAAVVGALTFYLLLRLMLLQL